MNTILTINAVSSFLAAVGIGCYLTLVDRRARRGTIVETMSVTTRHT